MHKISRDEQRINVKQLLSDRKDGVGGYATSIKDFENMGPCQGGNWPFSAESLRRAFGKPEDKEDSFESDYLLTKWAESHRLLENHIEGRGSWPSDLKQHCYSIYAAINAVFPRDTGATWVPGNLPIGGGNRDYEWLRDFAFGMSELEADLEVKKRKKNDKEKQREKEDRPLTDEELAWAGLQARREVDALEAEHDRREMARGLLIRVDIGIDYLVEALKNEDLFVKFARAMTIREAKEKDSRNAGVADFYEAQKASGKTGAAAALATRAEFGVSDRTIRRILEDKRLANGEPKRSRGRPKQVTR